MKKTKLGLGLGLILALIAGKVIAAGSFEGEVDYKMTMKNDSGEMDYFIKGHKVRTNTEMKGHKMGMILDWSAKSMVMLMDEQKMYMKHDLPTPDKSKVKVSGKFYKTGKTQVILGRKCAEWVYESEHGKTSMWAASGMGNFAGVQGEKGGADSAWADAVKTKGLFPLKVDVMDKDGKETMTMEATKLEKKSVSSSMFEIPSDYKNMGDMMGGMNIPKF
jgi:hypothetical protein